MCDQLAMKDEENSIVIMMKNNSNHANNDDNFDKDFHNNIQHSIANNNDTSSNNNTSLSRLSLPSSTYNSGDVVVVVNKEVAEGEEAKVGNDRAERITDIKQVVYVDEGLINIEPMTAADEAKHCTTPNKGHQENNNTTTTTTTKGVELESTEEATAEVGTDEVDERNDKMIVDVEEPCEADKDNATAATEVKEPDKVEESLLSEGNYPTDKDEMLSVETPATTTEQVEVHKMRLVTAEVTESEKATAEVAIESHKKYDGDAKCEAKAEFDANDETRDKMTIGAKESTTEATTTSTETEGSEDEMVSEAKAEMCDELEEFVLLKDENDDSAYEDHDDEGNYDDVGVAISDCDDDSSMESSSGYWSEKEEDDDEEEEQQLVATIMDSNEWKSIADEEDEEEDMVELENRDDAIDYGGRTSFRRSLDQLSLMSSTWFRDQYQNTARKRTNNNSNNNNGGKKTWDQISLRFKRASLLFVDMDRNNDGKLSKEEISEWVKANPIIWGMLSVNLNLEETKCIEIVTRVILELNNDDPNNNHDSDSESSDHGNNNNASIEEQEQNVKQEERGITKRKFKSFKQRFVDDPHGSQELFHRLVFSAFDDDDNKYLDPEEFDKFLDVFYETDSIFRGDSRLPSKEKLKEIAYTQLDANGDGKFEFEEIRSLISGSAFKTIHMDNNNHTVIDTDGNSTQCETEHSDDDEEDDDDSDGGHAIDNEKAMTSRTSTLTSIPDDETEDIDNDHNSDESSDSNIQNDYNDNDSRGDRHGKLDDIRGKFVNFSIRHWNELTHQQQFSKVF